jgi:membrane protein DedA with SNARE-associated domain
MHWTTFLVWNAAGGIIWATVYGTLGYVLGRNLGLLSRIVTALGIGGAVIAVIVIAGLIGYQIIKRRRGGAKPDDSAHLDDDSHPAPPRTPESARTSH